jgi:hypothetical protein
MRLFLLSLIMIAGILPAVSFGEGSDQEETDQDVVQIKRDPFRFGSKVPLGLNMVVLQENDKIAYINGKEYRIGDTVGGSKIVSISFDYVELSHEKEKWRMYVK